MQNALTDNVTFVEIRTLGTSITGNAYRTSGAQSLTADFSGGVVQVLGYRDTFAKSYSHLRSEALDRGEPDCKGFDWGRRSRFGAGSDYAGGAMAVRMPISRSEPRRTSRS